MESSRPENSHLGERGAPTAASLRDLRDLPKAHLHVHLEGAMRPSTLHELCRRDARPVPEIRGYGSFGEFADTYVAACSVLRSPDDLRRLIHEVVEDAALDGCAWIEPAFYPAHHVDRLGAEREIWTMAVEFGVEAGARFGIGVGWLAALDRTLGLDHADRVTDLVIDLVHDGAPIVALGLHNDEDGFPPDIFTDHFARAGEAGLLRTPHAGELAGPASVAGALDALDADRIQHGVRAVEDPALVRRLADSAVVLDVCPTSNVLLAVVDQIEDHPLPVLLDAGVRCTINGDDPLLFGPGIAEEYELCRSSLGLVDEQLAEVARTSFMGSAAPDALTEASVRAIDGWLADPV